MDSRMRGAAIGLLVSAAVIGFILLKLHDAGRPAPTAVHLVNVSAAPVSVDAVELGVAGEGAQAVLRGPFALAASAPPLVSKPLPLPPGRPVAVALRGDSAASCTLDPRPQGQCVVNAVYGGAGALQCDYDCKLQAAQR